MALHSKLLLLIVFTVPACNNALAQPSGSCTWTAGNGNWQVAGNWNCTAHDGVPTADDDVIIQTAGSVQVSIGADAECYSLTLGEASDTHSAKHRLRTTMDNVSIQVGPGGVLVHQSGEFLLGQDLSSVPAHRANLQSEGTILAYGRFWPRNSNIHGELVLDRPIGGGPRGYLQARGWNNIHGPLEVVNGGLEPVIWDRGHHGFAAPHIRVIDHDVVIHEGSSVNLFLNWAGGFGGVGHSQPGIQIENGVLRLHGGLWNGGFDQMTNQITAVIDAVTEVSATGLIGVRLKTNQGIELRGPEGTVHQMAGHVDTGLLLGADTPQQARPGPGLRVTSGRSLVSTGLIELHPMRSHQGEVSNTDGGVITHELEVDGAGLYVLGFPGPSEVRVNVESPGDLEWVNMAWHAEDHPQAGLESRIQGGHHWVMSAFGNEKKSSQLSEPVLHLSLPRFNPDESSAACRWLAGAGLWSCRGDAVQASHVSVGPLATIDGEWAVSEFTDAIFADRWELKQGPEKQPTRRERR